MDKILLEKLKTLVVLYAEDEEEIRKKISDSLNYYVKEVIEVSNGKEALECYREKKPDIVFTDIMMPHMSGIELIKKIREENKKTPIVIITAHTEKETLLSAIPLHLEQYIIKPINLKSLKNALKNCIETICTNHSITKNLPFGYSYDFDNRTLICKEEVLKLSKKEILFFELLLQNSHRIVSYEELQNYIWQDDIMTDSALKSLLRKIRQKFPKNYIKNFSGIGYKIG